MHTHNEDGVVVVERVVPKRGPFQEKKKEKEFQKRKTHNKLKRFENVSQTTEK